MEPVPLPFRVTGPSRMVYPYTNDRKMLSAPAFCTSSGLAENGSVVLITTDDLRYAVKRHLSGDGNVEVFERNGQLVFLNAAELLSSFMADGNPDPKLFKAGIKTLFERAGHHPYAAGTSRHAAGLRNCAPNQARTPLPSYAPTQRETREAEMEILAWLAG